MTDFEKKVSSLCGRERYFSPELPICISRAPGRLDLMGGNVDYTGGLVFQSTIREATWAAVQLRNDGLIVLWNPQMREHGWTERIEFAMQELSDEATVRKLVNRSPEIRWTAYVLGVFYLLRMRYPEQVFRGANLYLESDVPLNKGVSSSAAVEVSTLRAASAAYGVELEGVELAQACQWVENVIAESACGIMDQAASVLGDEGHILPLLCQPCMPRPLVRLPEGLQCWAIDSGVKHAVTGTEYEAARAAAFIGYRMICDWEGLPLTQEKAAPVTRFLDPRWNGYLSNISPSLFRSKYERRLPETMTGAEVLALKRIHPDPFTTVRPEVNYPVRACTRYAVEENQRVEMFMKLALSAGSIPAEDMFRLMGDLMFQSHWSYSECGLGCAETDQLVELVRQECGGNQLYGAKITGGGVGGTVAVLGAKGAGKAFRRVVGSYARAHSFEPYVFEGSSAGADRFGVLILQGHP